MPLNRQDLVGTYRLLVDGQECRTKVIWQRI
jgi:hypothetical protein